MTLALTLHFAPSPVSAQRYATCDLCGMCVNPDGTIKQGFDGRDLVPSNWGTCVSCVYGLPADLTPHPRHTLQVDDATNEPPAPAKGKYFTQLGCFSTNINFSSPTASADVMGTMLTLLYGVAGSVGFIYLIYGSGLLMLSRGDIEKVAEGRRVVTRAILGTIFTLLAVFIVKTIATNFLKIPGLG